MNQALVGVGLWAVMLIPPVRQLFESVMIIHMLVQLPLLILSGWLVGDYLIKRFAGFFENYNSNGIAGIILFMLITLFWMIPRSLDAALNTWDMELFKFFSLPVLAGIPLCHSWKRLVPLGRSFIIFNYLPMFGLLAWLYIDSPVRICNNYLVTEQKMLGWGFLLLTVGIIIYTIQNVFTDHSGAEN